MSDTSGKVNKSNPTRFSGTICLLRLAYEFSQERLSGFDIFDNQMDFLVSGAIKKWDNAERKVFILCGARGTGKSSFLRKLGKKLTDDVCKGKEADRVVFIDFAKWENQKSYDKEVVFGFTTGKEEDSIYNFLIKHLKLTVEERCSIKTKQNAVEKYVATHNVYFLIDNFEKEIDFLMTHEIVGDSAPRKNNQEIADFTKKFFGVFKEINDTCVKHNRGGMLIGVTRQILSLLGACSDNVEDLSLEERVYWDENKITDLAVNNFKKAVKHFYDQEKLFKCEKCKGCSKDKYCFKVEIKNSEVKFSSPEEEDRFNSLLKEYIIELGKGYPSRILYSFAHACSGNTNNANLDENVKKCYKNESYPKRGSSYLADCLKYVDLFFVKEGLEFNVTEFERKLKSSKSIKIKDSVKNSLSANYKYDKGSVGKIIEYFEKIELVVENDKEYELSPFFKYLYLGGKCFDN